MRPKFFGVTSTSTAVADVRVRFDLARFGQGNFVLRIGHVVDHEQVGQGADLTRLRIDVDVEIARGADALLRGREQGVRDRLEQDFAFDPALPLQVIQHGNKFGVHKNIAARRQKRVGHQLPLQSARGLDA